MRRGEDSYGDEPDGVTLPQASVIRETDMAIQVQLGRNHEFAEVWIPKGQILPDSPVQGGTDFGDLIVTEWIAMQKGLV